MTDQIIAAISDIHGNRWALENVLQDIDARGISTIVNLGDSFYGPLDPAGTAEVLLPRMIPSVRGNQDRMIPAVRGNEDRIIIEHKDGPTPPDTIGFVVQQLTPPNFDWLRQLNTTRIEDNILLCHGTPTVDTEYLLWEVCHDGRVRTRPSAEVESRIPSTESSIVLCGHSHVPNEVLCPNGTRVIDVGSVGLQAFTDDSPFDHKMETGSPHARYSILHITGNDVQVQRVLLEYDWESAASIANKNGRDDWAVWLKTGRAISEQLL